MSATVPLVSFRTRGKISEFDQGTGQYVEYIYQRTWHDLNTFRDINGEMIQRRINGPQYNPRTIRQRPNRAAFRLAVQWWQLMSLAARQYWAAAGVASKLPGYQAWISYARKSLLGGASSLWDSGLTIWDGGLSSWDVGNATSWDFNFSTWDSGLSVFDQQP